MSNRFDVIVIGGGPAGAAAALACRHRGLSTLLLERESAESEAVPIPGETLPPGIEVLFRALKLDLKVNAAGFHRHCGHFIESYRGSTFQAYGADDRGPWRGYLVDRRRLQEMLIAEAVKCGVVVRRGVPALNVIVAADRVVGIETRSGRFSCRFVVDASGGRQWLVHQLGLSQHRVSPPMVARFGWMKQARRSAPDPTPRLSLHNHGWEWEAPIRPDCHAWVSLLLRGNRDNFDTSPSSDSLKRAHIDHWGARDVSWRIASGAAGPGYFLVGDAAWILDPACSHGVLKAIMSAMVAAEAMAKCHDAAIERQQQLGYSAWLRDWFCRDAAALVTLYSELQSPPTWLASARETLRYIATSPVPRAFPSNSTQN